MTANEARQLRRRRHGPVVELEVRAPGDTRGDPSTGIERLDLRRALAHLSPEDRALLAMRYVVDLNSDELGGGPRHLAVRRPHPPLPGRRPPQEGAPRWLSATASSSTSPTPSAPTPEEAPTQVRPTELARQFAAAYPHGRRVRPLAPGSSTARLAWVLLLLAGLLAAMVGGLLIAGSQPDSGRAVGGRACAARVDARRAGAGRPGPAGTDPSAMAFDRRAGRLWPRPHRVDDLRRDVDVRRLHEHLDADASGSGATAPLEALVYDVDSDLTIGVATGGVGLRPRGRHVDREGRLRRDGRSGPTTRSPASSSPRDLLDGTAAGAVDLRRRDRHVDPDRRGKARPATGCGLAYDASVDRIVAYSPMGDLPPETWLFDIRTGTWSRAGAETPASWSRTGRCPPVTYDESAERTVVTGSAGMAAYDATADRWEVLAQPGEPYANPTVYDPVNRRLVGLGWEGDVTAFDLKTREWTVLLEPSPGPTLASHG